MKRGNEIMKRGNEIMKRGNEIMKRGNEIMRAWMLRGVVILLGAMLLWALFGAFSGYGHNPNHDIDMEQARAAANRVHTPPDPGAKMTPGAGG